MIAEIAQPLQAFVDVKKSRLNAHRFISDPTNGMESETLLNGQVFRNVQVPACVGATRLREARRGPRAKPPRRPRPPPFLQAMLALRRSFKKAITRASAIRVGPLRSSSRR